MKTYSISILLLLAALVMTLVLSCCHAALQQCSPEQRLYFDCGDSEPMTYQEFLAADAATASLRNRYSITGIYGGVPEDQIPSDVLTGMGISPPYNTKNLYTRIDVLVQAAAVVDSSTSNCRVQIGPWLVTSSNGLSGAPQCSLDSCTLDPSQCRGFNQRNWIQFDTTPWRWHLPIKTTGHVSNVPYAQFVYQRNKVYRGSVNSVHNLGDDDDENDTVYCFDEKVSHPASGYEECKCSSATHECATSGCFAFNTFNAGQCTDANTNNYENHLEFASSHAYTPMENYDFTCGNSPSPCLRSNGLPGLWDRKISPGYTTYSPYDVFSWFSNPSSGTYAGGCDPVTTTCNFNCPETSPSAITYCQEFSYPFNSGSNNTNSKPLTQIINSNSLLCGVQASPYQLKYNPTGVRSNQFFQPPSLYTDIGGVASGGDGAGVLNWRKPSAAQSFQSGGRYYALTCAYCLSPDQNCNNINGKTPSLRAQRYFLWNMDPMCDIVLMDPSNIQSSMQAYVQLQVRDTDDTTVTQTLTNLDMTQLLYQYSGHTTTVRGDTAAGKNYFGMQVQFPQDSGDTTLPQLDNAWAMVRCDKQQDGTYWDYTSDAFPWNAVVHHQCDGCSPLMQVEGHRYLWYSLSSQQYTTMTDTITCSGGGSLVVGTDMWAQDTGSVSQNLCFSDPWKMCRPANSESSANSNIYSICGVSTAFDQYDRDYSHWMSHYGHQSPPSVQAPQWQTYIGSRFMPSQYDPTDPNIWSDGTKEAAGLFYQTSRNQARQQVPGANAREALYSIYILETQLAVNSLPPFSVTLNLLTDLDQTDFCPLFDASQPCTESGSVLPTKQNCGYITVSADFSALAYANPPGTTTYRWDTSDCLAVGLALQFQAPPTVSLVSQEFSITIPNDRDEQTRLQASLKSYTMAAWAVPDPDPDEEVEFGVDNYCTLTLQQRLAASSTYINVAHVLFPSCQDIRDDQNTRNPVSRSSTPVPSSTQTHTAAASQSISGTHSGTPSHSPSGYSSLSVTPSPSFSSTGTATSGTSPSPSPSPQTGIKTPSPTHTPKPCDCFDVHCHVDYIKTHEIDDSLAQLLSSVCLFWILAGLFIVILLVLVIVCCCKCTGHSKDTKHEISDSTKDLPKLPPSSSSTNSSNKAKVN